MKKSRLMALFLSSIMLFNTVGSTLAYAEGVESIPDTSGVLESTLEEQSSEEAGTEVPKETPSEGVENSTINLESGTNDGSEASDTGTGSGEHVFDLESLEHYSREPFSEYPEEYFDSLKEYIKSDEFSYPAFAEILQDSGYFYGILAGLNSEAREELYAKLSSSEIYALRGLALYEYLIELSYTKSADVKEETVDMYYDYSIIFSQILKVFESKKEEIGAISNFDKAEIDKGNYQLLTSHLLEEDSSQLLTHESFIAYLGVINPLDYNKLYTEICKIDVSTEDKLVDSLKGYKEFLYATYGFDVPQESESESESVVESVVETESESETEKASESKELYSESTETEGGVESEASTESQVEESKTVEEALEELPTVDEVLAISGDKEVTSEAIEEVVGGDTGFLFIEDLEALAEAGYDVSEYLEEPEVSEEELASAAASKLASSDELSFLSSAKNISMYSSVPSSGATSTGATGTISSDSSSDDSVKVYLTGTNSYFTGTAASEIYNVKKYVTYKSTKYDAFCINPLLGLPSGSKTVYYISNNNMLKTLYYGYGGPGFGNSACNLKTLFDNYITSHISNDHMIYNYNTYGRSDIIYATLTARLLAKIAGDSSWAARLTQDAANMLANDCYNKINSATVSSKINTYSVHKVYSGDSGSQDLVFLGPVCRSQLIINPNGGTWNSSTSNSTFTDYIGNQKTIANPTKSGYTFGGWTVSGGGTLSGTKFTYGSTSTTLTAKWSSSTYTVTYNANGGSGAPSAQTKTAGKALTLSSTKPTRSGCRFLGWGTSSTATSVAYAPGASYTTDANITLYAIWRGIYTVKYNGNGSTSGSMTDDTFDMNVSTALKANAYSKTGHTFKNWNTNSGGTGTSYSDKASVKNLTTTNGGSVTLYAQWTPITYSVKYNANGGSGTMSNSSHTYGVAKALTANSFTRSGYTFKGWSTSSTSSTVTYTDKQSVTNLSSTNGATVNLYAVWEQNKTYTVKYNSNKPSTASGTVSGSTASSTHTVGVAKNLTSNGFSLTGWTFKNWNTVAGGTGTSYSNGASVKDLSTTNGATVNLYAQWTANTYSVKYNANGGSGTMSNSSHTYDTAKTLTKNTFTRSGYNFKGWSTSSTSTTVTYTDQQSVKNLTSTNGGTVNLYAVWEQIKTYTVKYNSNKPSTASGTVSGSTASSTHTVGVAKNLTTNGFSLTGWTFKNWNTVAGGTGTSYSNGQSVTDLSTTNGATVNLYAQWTANTYTVKYNANGGSGTMTSSTHTYDTAKTLTKNTFTRTGYTFKGWSISNTATTATYSDQQSVKNLTSTNGGTVNLYAVWEIVSTTLTVNPNGGTWNSSTSNQTFTQNYNTTKTIANPTRTGYTFGGWTHSGGGSLSGTTFTFGTSNATLTAKWTGNSVAYTVKHYKQDLGGTTYTLAETENKTGTAGTSVTPAVKSYTGFTAPSTQTVTIKADGSTVVEYRYTRNSYTVTLTKGTGIATVTGAGTYKYGASVTINATMSTGYSWSKWSGTHSTTTQSYTFTMPASNVTDTANATPTTYTITYDLNGGTVATANPTSYNVTTATFTLNNPTKTGYTFKGWTGSNGSTAQTTVSIAKGSTGNKSYTANWTGNSVAYTVKHYKQDLGASTYTLAETENKTGTAGTSVTPAVKSYSGFTAPSTKTVTIAGDGSTLVEYKYTRNSYTVTLNKGTGVSTVTGAGTYQYGASVTINATMSSGYSWSKWSGTHSTTTQKYTFTMPASNVTDTANATPTTYTITYNLNGGTVSTANPTSYNVTTATFTLNNPTKVGYTFTGWTGSNGSTPQTTVSVVKGSTGNKTYTANWSGNPAAYTVKHYKQDLGAATYTLAETENLTATAGSSVTPAVKSYTGFTAPSTKTVTIAGDGSTLVEYKYTRNSYTVTLNKGTGIATVTGAGTYQYGASVTINATLSSGYAWSKWSGTHSTTTQKYTFTMPASNVTDTANATVINYTISYNLNGGTVATANPTSYNVTTATFTLNNPTKVGYTFTGWTGSNGSTAQTSVSIAKGSTGNKSYTANWSGNPVSYTVKHYKQDLDGTNYTLAETENLTATAGSSVTPAVKSYTGFTAPSTQTVSIKGDGTTLVEYKYTRNSYTVTLNKGTGITTVSGAGTYKYGASVTINATPLSGYSWSKWSGTHSTTTQKYTFTMPASNVTDTANATVINYTISYNLDGGTVATANPTSYNVTTATFTLNNPTKTGYTFKGWTGSNGTTAQTSVSVAIGSTGNKTYTANWTLNPNTKYTVKHYKQDLNSTTYTLADTDNLTGTTGASVTPAVKSYTGFTAPSTQTVTIKGDGTTLVEYKYTRNSYTVTLNKGTGVASVSGAGTYKYGASVTINATMSSGYSWSKWSGTHSTTTQNYTFTMPASNVTDTANASLITYTIGYTLNGGTVATANPTSYNVTTETFTLNNPTKTGYTFKGWTGSNGSTPQVSVSIAKGSTGNKSYTANWTANTYTISYNANGGSGSMSDQTVTYDAAASIATNTFTRTGYRFAGWTTKSDGTDDGYNWTGWSGTWKYVNGQYGISGGKLVLYARWTPNTYTIVYNSNKPSTASGTISGTTANSSHTYDVSKALTSNGYSLEGWSFAGWNTKADGSGSPYGNGVSIKNLTPTHGGTITLYAQWTANTYTVVYNGNGNTGGSTSSSTHTYDVAKNLTANGFSKTGYTFAGWNTAANGSGKPYSNSESVKNLIATNGGTVTLYAQWTINSYTLTVNPNSGTWSGSTAAQSFTLNYGVTKSIPVPTKTGYTFMGWSQTGNPTGIRFTDGYTSSKATGTGTFQSTSNGTYTNYKWVDISATANTWNHITFGNYSVSANDTVKISGYIRVNTNTGTTLNLYHGAKSNDYSNNKKSISYASGWQYFEISRTFTEDTTTGMFEIYTSNLSGKTGTIDFDVRGIRIENTTTGTVVSDTDNVKMSAGNVSLTANWEANNYSVVFNSNTGSGTMPNQSFVYDTAQNLTTNAFTKTGYTFKNWNTKADGSGDSYSDKASVKNLTDVAGGTVTLYAQWIINSYTLTVNPNKGTWNGSTSSQTFTQNYATTKSIPNPTRTGYRFSAWTLSGAGSFNTTNKVFTYGAGDGTLTAGWNANTYTIVYDSNKPSTASGTISGTTTSSTHTYDVAKNLTTNGYSLEGWVFTGWNRNKDGSGSSYGNSASVKNLTTTHGDTITLYAQWSPITYTVAYNGNTNTGGSTASSTHTYDVAKNLTANGFTKTGYTFAGWNTAADGSGKSYSNSESVKNLTTTNSSTVTLYAQWTLNTYTISYTLNGGTVATANPTSYNVNTATFTLNNPTRTGYTFKGWTGSNGSTPQTTVSIAKGSTGNKVYTANWTAHTYSVAYNSNKPSTASSNVSGTMANSSHTYDVAKNLITNAYTLKGWRFNGWNTEANGSGKSYANGASVTNLTSVNGGIVTLYAQWVANTYTVTYNGNGNTGGSTANSSHVYDVAKTLTANGFTKTGYTFAGWNTAADGSGSPYSNKASVVNLTDVHGGTVTLYAQWTINSYTLTVNPNGGTWNGSTSSKTFTQNYNTTKTIADPTRVGYRFGSWTLSGAGSFNTTNKVFTYGAGNSSLTAQWNANTYTVVYDKNKPSNASGTVTGTMANSSHTYDVAKALTTNSYSLVGWEFTGWNTKADGSGDPYSNGASVKNLTSVHGGTVTLYAQWRAHTYTVTYNSNKPSGASATIGGTTANSTHTYDVAKNLTTNGYTLTGWTFTGWNTAADGSGDPYGNGVSVKNLTTADGGTVTLYAQWKANTYTVVYNSNKPSTASSAVAGTMSNSSHTYDIAKNLNTNTYTLKGWTFAGWNTAADGSGKPYANSASVKNLTATSGGTVTLYAQWTANTYTVVYNSNKPSTASASISGTTASSTHTYDVAKKLTTNGYTLTGWTFTGWNTKADGSGNSYDNGASVSNLVSSNNGSITLYAQWTANTYTVVYDKNKPATASGTVAGTTASSSHTYDVAKNLTTNGYTLTGWTFTGWNTAADGSGKAYSNGASVSNLVSSKNGSITLYAQWSANTYTVTYNSNKPTTATGTINGTTANSSHTYDVAKALTTNGYSLVGWTFTGWNTKADGSGTGYANKASVTNLASTTGATVTLYAQWRANTYTVVYNGNGSDGGKMSSVTYTYDVAKNLNTNAFIRTGYTFKNWNTKPDGTGTSYVNGASIKNLISTDKGTVTLYAQWTLNTYTIGYNLNGGTVSTANPTSYSVTSANISLNKPSKTGYTFKNWSESISTSTWYSGFINLNTGDFETDSSYPNSVYSERIFLKSGVSYTLSGTSLGGIRWRAFKADGTYIGNMSSSATYTPNQDMYVSILLYEGATATNRNAAKITSTHSSVTIPTGSTGNRSYVANWTANTYTVVYNSNKPATASGTISGTTANSTHTYDVAKNLTTNGYSLVGWKFTGWNTKADGTGDSYSDGASVKNLIATARGTITLYAQWSANTYTVVYNSNKPSTASATITGTMANSSHTYDVAKNLTANAYKLTGWTFTGWNTKADGSGDAYNNSQSVVNLVSADNGSITLYAQWRANTYTVVYSKNKPATASSNVTGTMPNTVHTYDSPAFSITGAYKLTGWTFTGWNTKADGSGTSIAGSFRNLTSVDGGTVTLYAQWRANTYTVTYNSNKPSTTGTLSGSTANSSHTYDVAKNITTNGYSLVGYTFKNWNTKADGSGTAYSNGASVKNLTPTNGATVTLYAQWTPNPDTKYTVKHYKMDLDGVNYTLADTDNLTGTTDTSVTPAVKTYTGFTSPSPQTVNVDPDGSRVVEYRYTRNKYYIDLNYTLDGVAGKIDGVSSSSGPYSFTITVNGTTKTGKGDHYTQYYYGSPYSVTIAPDAGYSASQTTWSGTLGAGNMSITVPLKTIIYTITYNLNGGTLDNPVTSYHVRTPDITLPEPIKPGYTFLGWYKSSSFSGSPVTTIPKGSIGNVTLYAKWQVNEYTMIFNENAALGLGTENLYKHTYDIGYYTSYNQNALGLVLKSDSSVPGGRYFERTFQNSNSAGSRFGFYYNTLSDERLTVGETYTWSVYVKADRELEMSSSTLGSEQGGHSRITIGTEWKRVTCTFTATDNSYDAFIFYFVNGEIEAGDKLYFHSLEMHKGSQAHISSFVKNYDTTLGTLPTPTRDGYQFLGWYTDPVGGTQITEDTMVPLGGAEYYAHWVSVPELDIKFNYYFKDTDYTIDDVKVNAKATDAEYGDISDDVVVTKITSPSGAVVDNPTEFTPTELGTFEVEYSVTNEDSITTTDTGVVYSVNNGSQTGDSSTVLRTYNRYISGFALGTLETNSIWRTSAYRAIIDASLSNTTPLSGFDTVNSEAFISSVR